MHRSSLFRSATFKLTVSYVLIVMIISLSFSVALYHIATTELARGLSRESERIYTQFPIFHDSLMLETNPDYETGARHILLQLALLNSAVFIATGLAGYKLARRTLQPIEIAHEQQKRFTADVSHELRTPLTALRTEAEVGLLNDAASTQELRAVITSNLEEAGKIETLINSLLRLTRLETDVLQQSFTTFAAAEVLHAAIDDVTPLAQKRSIALKAPKKIPTSWCINGDKTSLTQLLVIILDNAVKYSPDQSTIEITTKLKGSHLNITVTDQGKGIAPGDLEHVFDRFYRADNSRTKQAEDGFGLGLSIAKMIADLHDADITIQSKLNAGTSVTLTLPIVRKSDT